MGKMTRQDKINLAFAIVLALLLIHHVYFYLQAVEAFDRLADGLIKTLDVVRGQSGVISSLQAIVETIIGRLPNG